MADPADRHDINRRRLAFVPTVSRLSTARNAALAAFAAAPDLGTAARYVAAKAEADAAEDSLRAMLERFQAARGEHQ